MVLSETAVQMYVWYYTFVGCEFDIIEGCLGQANMLHL